VVRPAGSADAPALCAVLAQAFEDDPVAVHLIPSHRRRLRGLEAFFRLQLTRDLLPQGCVFTTEDRSGAALWAPPGMSVPNGLAVLVSLVPLAPYVVGREMARSVRSLARITSLRPREPHWYLAVLGTDPSRQGQGIGSALLQPVLARCDAEGARAYLESSKESNVPFYRRHGFHVAGEVHLPRGPTVWTMWREPRPPG
jgi:GNAT superfamily N-acetyltransferase